MIARLDPSLETQIEQQQANVARAQAVERLRWRSKMPASSRPALAIFRPKPDPENELEAAEVNVRSGEAQLRSAQAGLTQARANLNQTRVNLDYTIIHSPIDGIVISRNVDVGQTVAASMQAPTLYLLAADLTKMKVNANIDEADVGRIRPGQVVRFRVDAFPTDDFFGKVSQIRLQPAVVQNVVTHATVIDVPNPELKLKPGMTANVTIEIARRSNVTRVPTMALRFRPTTDMFAALGQEPPSGDARPCGRGVGCNRHAGAASRRRGDRRRIPGAPQRPEATGNGNSTPAGPAEPRRRFQERMQNMSPEERAQFAQRMRERGFEPSRRQRKRRHQREALLLRRAR